MEIDRDVRQVLQILQQNNHEAYVVGGCVRDGLMGNAPNDWDVCTAALPAQVAACFADYHVIETGLKHGTVTVVINRTPVEITTYRVDGKYGDNRRPDEVHFVRSLAEDLARRDFTMNAIAFSPDTGFVDPYGGAKDIQNKIIRCVGAADTRFGEDALRILRALRFASRFGFAIETKTDAAIHSGRQLLRNISAERLAAELGGLLQGDFVRNVLLRYADVLQVFIPEIAPMAGFAQKNPYHQYDVWRHTAESVAAIAPTKVLRLTMLFHDSGKPATHSRDAKGIDHFYGHGKKSVDIAATVLRRLKMDNATVAAVTELIHWHDTPIAPRSVVKWLHRLGEERFEQLLQVKEADVKAQAVSLYQERLAQIEELRRARDAALAEERCFKRKDLAVNGNDLLAAGFEASARMGEVLDALLWQVMEGKLPNEKAALLKAAAKYQQRKP